MKNLSKKQATAFLIIIIFELISYIYACYCNFTYRRNCSILFGYRSLHRNDSFLPSGTPDRIWHTLQKDSFTNSQRNQRNLVFFHFA